MDSRNDTVGRDSGRQAVKLVDHPSKARMRIELQ
jgi:hypothetical protein